MRFSYLKRVPLSTQSINNYIKVGTTMQNLVQTLKFFNNQKTKYLIKIQTNILNLFVEKHIATKLNTIKNKHIENVRESQIKL